MPTLTVFHSAAFASYLAFTLPVSAELRAGSAKVVITSIGVNMAGYYNYRACESWTTFTPGLWSWTMAAESSPGNSGPDRTEGELVTTSTSP